MTEYIQGIDISEAQGPNVDHRLVASLRRSELAISPKKKPSH